MHTGPTEIEISKFLLKILILFPKTLFSEEAIQIRIFWNMKLEGKHFLVTGGSSGLGAAAVNCLVEKGCKVTILDRDAELAEAVKKGAKDVLL